MADTPTIFTKTSAYSLGGVVAVGLIANAFDALIHFIFEGSFLWMSLFGRQVNNQTGPLAEMWREYAAADFRWGVSEPGVVSLELLTVFGAGTLCCYILKQLVNDDPARHYWLIILSTAELYGGWMTFCPEWLTGSPNLNTSNPLHFWVYLVLMNLIWVFIPVWLMIDSYTHIAGALRAKQATTRAKRA